MSLHKKGLSVIIGGLPEAMQSDPPAMHPMYVWDNTQDGVVFKGDPAFVGASPGPKSSGLVTYTSGDGIGFYSNPVWQAIGIASVGASAYHGYKRNNSLGWGIGWGILGGLFPILTPAIALAQGFGKPAKGKR